MIACYNDCVSCDLFYMYNPFLLLMFSLVLLIPLLLALEIQVIIVMCNYFTYHEAMAVFSISHSLGETLCVEDPYNL